MKKFVILVFLAIIILNTSFAFGFISDYEKRVNISLSASRNQTIFVNLSAANVTVQQGKGMEIKVTDFNNNILAYQTIINGRWYYNGIDHNISNPWRRDNYTVVLLPSNRTLDGFYIYFNNITQQPDESSSILVRYDDFAGYPAGDFYPFWITEQGAGATICQPTGSTRNALCTTGGAGQHIKVHINMSNTEGHTVNIELNATDGGTVNGMFINDGGYRTPQENPGDVYNLLLTGGGSCGANATISTAFSDAAMNITFDRDDGVRNLYMRSSNTALEHISCVDSSSTNINTIEVDGAGANSQQYAVMSLQLYNVTTFVRNQPELTINTPESVTVLLTINFPANVTYLTNNMTFNWSLSGGTNPTLPCWKNLDGTETFLNSTQSGKTNTSFSGNLEIGSHTITIICEDSGLNYTDSKGFSIIHSRETQEFHQNNVLETNITFFELNVETAGAVKSITGNITYNATVYAFNVSLKNSTTFNLTSNQIRVPLLDANNSRISWNWSYNLVYHNNSVSQNFASNLSNHTAIFAYYIENIISSSNPSSERELISLRTNVRNFVNVASVAVNSSFNQTSFESSLVLSSGTVRNYSVTVESPLVSSSSETFAWNSTIYITYNSVTKARMSANANHIVNQIGIVSICGASDKRIFNFTYYDEESYLPISRINLSNDANIFEATFLIYQNTRGDLGSRNTTFNRSGSVYYEICQSGNANFKVDANIRYYNTTTYTNARFFYYRNQNVTNSSTINQKLFMLQDALSTQEVFKILSGTDVAPNIVLQVKRYYPQNNTEEIVAVGLTDANGITNTYIRTGTAQYNVYLYDISQVLKFVSGITIFPDQISTQANPQGSSNNPIIYNILSGAIESIYTNLFSVQSSCTHSVSEVSCTYNDTSGKSRTTHLALQQLGVVAWTQVCLNSSSASAGTLICLVPAGNNSFIYTLMNNETVVFRQSFQNYTSAYLYGDEGLVFAIILIMVLALLLSFNPVTCIGGALMGLGFSFALGFIKMDATGSILGLTSIIMVGILIMYKVRG